MEKPESSNQVLGHLTGDVHGPTGPVVGKLSTLSW